MYIASVLQTDALRVVYLAQNETVSERDQFKRLGEQTQAELEDTRARLSELRSAVQQMEHQHEQLNADLASTRKEGAKQKDLAER